MPTKSLKLFLTNLIDYAGLFPPANLDLIAALKNYRDYIECEDQWMMSQFIIPVNELENITVSDMEQFDETLPLDLSILSRNIAIDIEKLKSFKNKFSNKVNFFGIETRIGIIDDLQNLLCNTYKTIQDENLNLTSFFEHSYTENWIEEMQIVVKTISDFNKSNQTNFGFKLRCGGVRADMFPSPGFIAIAVINCFQNNVPMKFTAGLHHPIRHYNDSVNTKMYGFFNIFIGGMVAQKYKMDSEQLIEILKNENEHNFKFNENALIWKDYQITNVEIRQFRSSQFISYGSCSFDEPREDLINLGIF